MLAGFVFYSTNNQLCCGHPYDAHYLRICTTASAIPHRGALWETQESLGKTHFS